VEADFIFPTQAVQKANENAIDARSASRRHRALAASRARLTALAILGRLVEQRPDPLGPPQHTIVQRLLRSLRRKAYRVIIRALHAGRLHRRGDVILDYDWIEPAERIFDLVSLCILVTREPRRKLSHKQ
jgi:hypothetical protein